MIYESINELIEAIKEEECFKSYHDSLQVFKLPEVESLMREMNRLNEEKEDLECGLITMDDIRKDLGGNVYGERVKEYQITTKSNGEIL